MTVYRTILLSAILAAAKVAGFVVVPWTVDEIKSAATLALTSRSQAALEADWVSLADGVQKRIIQEGKGEVAEEGSEVEVDYVGTLYGEKDWSVDDVVECWLKNQQGLDHLADGFVKAGIDGKKLMNPDLFTEDFVANELGVSNKIQCKKIVMAAKRIAKQQEEFDIGTEFDSSKERGPFKFTLGEGKAIRAYELAVATMKQGERAEIICRSDYAYGSEGLRKQDGTVIIPPFGTLCFDITLLKC